MLYFFFSYARVDLNETEYTDPYLIRFYNDLTQEISQRTAIPRDQVGFRDEESILLGTLWPDALVKALRTAKVFISIYSPTYFTREWCGKEWTIFTSRINNKYAGRETPLIIPVLWRKVDKNIPTYTSKIQSKHYDLGKTYAKEGLQYLIKLNKHKDDYYIFLHHLAERIVQAVEEYPLPELSEDVDPDKVENAFETTTTSHSNNLHDQNDTGGPNCAKFVYVVGKKNELQSVKQDVSAYDNWAMNWKPYWPIKQRIVMITQDASTKMDLVHQHISFNNTLIREVKNAKENNNIVVIIVDSWTLMLPQSLYHKLMCQYDESHFFNCVLLVIFNFEDQETKKNNLKLKQKVEEIFFTKFHDYSGDGFIDEVKSKEELDEQLIFVLEKTKQKIIKFSQNKRIVNGTDFSNIPTINAVG